MTEETTLAVQPQTNGLTPWGSREEVKEIAARLKRFVPGTKNMNDDEIMAYAQLVHMTGLNPCSGELHGWDSKGGGRGILITKLGYGILVRWAQSQEPFTTRFTTKLNTETEDITARCQLLRRSDRQLLKQLLANDAPYREALDWATTEGIGIITKAERWSKKYKKWIDPPKSKSWEWKAEKRALEDAIRRAYGTPSTQELARQTWIVAGIATTPEDWKDVTPEMLPSERAATARHSAQLRLTATEREERPRSAAQDIAELFGEEIVNGETGEIVEPPEPEPEETTPNGLESLLEEVNEVLFGLDLEEYADLDAMKAMLEELGYTSYKATSHETMRLQLISRNKPNGKDHSRDAT